MRIVVDRDLCEANRRCADVAPEVFHVDDRDQLHVRVEYPSSEQLAAVEKALRVCPRRALALIQGTSRANS